MPSPQATAQSAVPRARTSGGGSSRDYVQSRVSGQSRHEDWSGQSTSEWNEDQAREVTFQLDGRAVRPCDHKDLDNLTYETRVSELLENQETNRSLLS